MPPLPELTIPGPAMNRLRSVVSQRVHQLLRHLVERSVDAWVGTQAQVRLIQLGANDGVMADPVHRIVRKPNVSSVLVEPVPRVFERLTHTYRSCPEVTCLQSAVVPDEETSSIEFFFLQPRDGLFYDDAYSGWSSTSRDHLEKFRQYVRNFDELLCSEMVPCVSVNRVFQMAEWPSVDLLQIDVEGLDVDIVGSIDFTTWTPKIIRFEHMHSAKAPLFALLRRLHTLRYHTFSSGFDTLCVQAAELRSFRWLLWMEKVHPAWLSPPR